MSHLRAMIQPPDMIQRLVAALGTLGLGLLLAGCAQPVQPWEKQYLARPEMSFNANPAGQRIREQLFTSKEAASGGQGVGGGGCGCN